jgi:hypothetical protein
LRSQIQKLAEVLIYSLQNIFVEAPEAVWKTRCNDDLKKCVKMMNICSVMIGEEKRLQKIIPQLTEVITE